MENRAGDCWTMVPAKAEQSCQRQLNNTFFLCFFCWISRRKYPQGNVYLKIPFRVSPYQIKTNQAITIRDKLAGFSIVHFLLKCTREETALYVRECLSVETCVIKKPVSWFAMQISWLVSICCKSLLKRISQQILWSVREYLSAKRAAIIKKLVK